MRRNRRTVSRPAGLPSFHLVDHAAELAFRQQVFDALANVVANTGVVTREQLSAFPVAGTPRRLIDQSRGIWNPRELAATLAVVSSPDGPYADAELEGGLFRYDYRAGSTGGDNTKLRAAYELQLPIILLRKIDNGVPRTSPYTSTRRCCTRPTARCCGTACRRCTAGCCCCPNGQLSNPTVTGSRRAGRSSVKLADRRRASWARRGLRRRSSVSRSLSRTADATHTRTGRHRSWPFPRSRV